MKYLLLIMTILQIKTFWSSFKNIFKSNKAMINEVDAALQAAEDVVDDKDIMLGLMTIFMVASGIFLTVYYILAGIYVGSIIFAILSSIYTINSWRHIGKALRYIDKLDVNIIKKTLFDRIYSAIYLSYIGYLIYYLITTW